MELLIGLLAIPIMLLLLIAPLAIVGVLYTAIENLFGELNIIVSLVLVFVLPVIAVVFIDALLLGA